MLLVSQPPVEPLPSDEPVVIGLVNNMPDAALRSTERQFHELLSAASQTHEVRIRHFTLPELVRAPAAQSHINQHYEDLSELWASQIDGLIVTGTEPRASALTEEPYWDSLTRLVDWAQDHTFATIWSCLAAHAATLHIDGITRRRLPKKLSGVFGCVKAEHHRIVADIPARWSVPHSRHNDLAEEELISRGYHVLYRSADTGADVFVKHESCLNVFFQGHPEYEPDTLLREYRRDVGRFLTGEADSYPEMPCGYFDGDAVAALAAFRRQALYHRDVNLLPDFPMVTAEQRLSYHWRVPAVSIYSNWMSYLADRKTFSLKASDGRNR